MGCNETLVRKLMDNCAGLTYKTNANARANPFLCPGESYDEFMQNIFSYITPQERSWWRVSSDSDKSVSMWHADGGPSTIFMGITLEGSRILQVENTDGERMDLPMHPG